MCNQQSLRSACAYAQSDQSICLSLEYPMSVKLLTEHHLRFLSLKAGCRGSSESTLVKMPHCWKSHVMAHLSFSVDVLSFLILLHRTYIFQHILSFHFFSWWYNVDRKEADKQLLLPGNSTGTFLVREAGGRDWLKPRYHRN